MKPFLNFDEMKKLLLAVKDFPVEQLVIRLLANGLSTDDILALTGNSYYKGTNELKFIRNGEPRIVSLDRPTGAYLLKYLDAMMDAPNDALFSIDSEYIITVIADAASRAGVAEVAPQALTSTWAFNAIHNGQDCETVHRQLGGNSFLETARLITTLQKIDNATQPAVFVFIPTGPEDHLVIDAARIALRALDYSNYQVFSGDGGLSSGLAAFRDSKADFFVYISPKCLVRQNALKMALCFLRRETPAIASEWNWERGMAVFKREVALSMTHAEDAQTKIQVIKETFFDRVKVE